MAEGGDAEIVREVLTVFQTDTATRLKSLETALAAGNMALVRTQAHSIKGSASQVGAPGVAALCQRIEREADPVAISELLRELESSFAQVCRLITESLG
jgi:HPt (histidine-containing phosphotransfer) domain-containing protein